MREGCACRTMMIPLVVYPMTMCSAAGRAAQSSRAFSRQPEGRPSPAIDDDTASHRIVMSSSSQDEIQEFVGLKLGMHYTAKDMAAIMAELDVDESGSVEAAE